MRKLNAQDPHNVMSAQGFIRTTQNALPFPTARLISSNKLIRQNIPSLGHRAKDRLKLSVEQIFKNRQIKTKQNQKEIKKKITAPT